MLPFINVFGFQIATYGLIIFIGLFIGAIIAIQYFSKQSGEYPAGCYENPGLKA